MPPTKYDQFIVSEPFSARCKQNHGEGHERSYVSITCPYCRIKFVEVTNNAIGKLQGTLGDVCSIQWRDCARA